MTVQFGTNAACGARI